MVRYGLVLIKPKSKKPYVRYMNTRKSPKTIRKKFYGSAYHFKTESTLLSIRKVPKGTKLVLSKGKHRKRKKR